MSLDGFRHGGAGHAPTNLLSIFVRAARDPGCCGNLTLGRERATRAIHVRPFCRTEFRRGWKNINIRRTKCGIDSAVSDAATVVIIISRLECPRHATRADARSREVDGARRSSPFGRTSRFTAVSQMYLRASRPHKVMRAAVKATCSAPEIPETCA